MDALATTQTHRTQAAHVTRSRHRAPGDTRTTTQRGYGNLHQKLKRQLTPIVDRGDAHCQEIHCLMTTRWIPPHTAWDLAHDRVNGGYLGPAHMRCNRSEGARYLAATTGRSWPRRRRGASYPLHTA
jgi:hypothetical protein